MLGLSSQQLASLVITLLAARHLMLSDYGTYMLAVVMIELATVFTYSGFYHYIIQSRRSDDAVQSSMFWVITGIGILTCGALFLFSDLIAGIFDTPDLARPLQLLAVLQPFSAMIAWASACLTRQARHRAYFTCLITSNLGSLIFGAMLIITWPSLYALVAYRAIRVGIGLVLFLPTLGRWPRWRFSRKVAFEAASYAKGLYGTRLLGFFSNFGTDLLLAYLFTTTESGLYRIANRLASAAIDIVTLPMKHFALQAISQTKRMGRSLTPVISDLIGATALFTGGVAICALFLGPAVVDGFFHQDYLVIIPAFYALTARAALSCGHALIEPILAGTAQNSLSFRFHLIWTAILLAISLFTASQGVLALSIGQACVALASSVAAFFILRGQALMDGKTLRNRLCCAFVLVSGFAILFGLGWHGLGFIQPSAAVFVSLILACYLGGLTIRLALRWRLFSLRVFHSK